MAALARGRRPHEKRAEALVVGNDSPSRLSRSDRRHVGSSDARAQIEAGLRAAGYCRGLDYIAAA